MKVDILGTKYAIIQKNYSEDESFEKNSWAGYCNIFSKQIVVCDMHTYKGWEKEHETTISEAHKQNLRHEIVHAFLMESGLNDNSSNADGPWAHNEEMVDWIALQGLKIYKAWQEANAM